MPRPTMIAALLTGALAAQLTGAAQSTGGLMPITDIRAGMSGTGRTVFKGDTLEDFRVEILGVLHNIIAPKRDLILARLSGGPLATTGVIAGMSGSPVYVDGKLIGAVSYALGSFPREPIAGITPIGEMIAEANDAGARTRATDLQLPAAPTASDIFGAIRRLADRSLVPITLPAGAMSMTGASVDAAPVLRPIGAAFVIGGFDPAIKDELRNAVGAASVSDAETAAPQLPANPAALTLHAGEAVGVSLIAGDFEMGATGTVTYVDGTRVYAFGHPFLNLGPTSIAMRQAHIFAILPSLDSSMKIAGMGPIVGAMTQDRATAIGGTLGPAPRELKLALTIAPERGREQRFAFEVLHDQTLTPLFAYVAVLNSLAAFERQNGALSTSVTGTINFGAAGTLTIDDMFSGDAVAANTAATILGPLTAMVTNEWQGAMPQSADLRIKTSEQPASATIERAWLDTTRPEYGETSTLHVSLRNFRGTVETVSLPVTMPAQATGPLTLMVSDAPTLSGLEQHELHPGKPRSLAELLDQLNTARRNQMLYVRLLSSAPGTVIGGETLPALPASARDVFGADCSQTSTLVTRSVIGSWELRLDKVVRGSRELPIVLTPKRH